MSAIEKECPASIPTKTLIGWLSAGRSKDSPVRTSESLKRRRRRKAKRVNGTKLEEVRNGWFGTEKTAVQYSCALLKKSPVWLVGSHSILDRRGQRECGLGPRICRAASDSESGQPGFTAGLVPRVEDAAGDLIQSRGAVARRSVLGDSGLKRPESDRPSGVADSGRVRHGATRVPREPAGSPGRPQCGSLRSGLFVSLVF